MRGDAREFKRAKEMVAEAREYPSFDRNIPDFRYVHKRRNFRKSLPLRISARWFSLLGSYLDTAWRQKTVKRLREQAERNALTLWFMSLMFVVTWVLQVVIYVVGK